MSSRAALLATFALCGAHVAWSDVQNFVVKKEGGTWGCKPAKPTPDTKEVKIAVNVEGTYATTPAPRLSYAYTNRDKTTGSGDLAAPKAPDVVWTATLPADKIAEIERIDVAVSLEGGKTECPAFQPSVAGAGGGGGEERAKDDTYEALDLQAMSWWATGGFDAFKKGIGATGAGTFPRGTQFLVHLPSGAPAFPFASSISERAPAQVVVIVDRNALPTSFDFEVVSCPAKDLFRIKGDFGAAGKIQGKRAPDFAPIPVGRLLDCGGGELTYTLKLQREAVPLAQKTQSVHVREVYHLAATFLYGFDFAKQPTFSAPDGKVVTTTDNVGPGLRLGFTWFPFGIDYQDMRWYNYVFNPVAAFDLSAPKDSFMVGNAFTPSGGVSLVIGLSFHRFPVLNGVTEGGAFTGKGDVPTSKEWNRQGRSFYIGLAADDKVFTAIKGLLGTRK